MNSQVFGNWIQIITGLAVVFGLFLVFIELRQAKQIASAELVSQGFSEGLSTQRGLMGEEFASVLANACLHPRELTDDQVVALDFYFQVQLNNVYRMEFIDTVAEITTPDIVMIENLRPILVTEHGRYWIAKKECVFMTLLGRRHRALPRWIHRSHRVPVRGHSRWSPTRRGPRRAPRRSRTQKVGGSTRVPNPRPWSRRSAPHRECERGPSGSCAVRLRARTAPRARCSAGRTPAARSRARPPACRASRPRARRPSDPRA